MTQPKLFSSGIELAAFVTSCQTLCKSWGVISSRYEGITSNEGVKLSWKVYKEPGSDLTVIASDLTVIAFEATPDSSSNLQPDLVSSSDLKQKAFLQFMCTKNNPVLSLNNTAVSLFCENHQNLDQLKSEINGSTPLIVTGHGLGGSVASLFTISLLDSIGSGKNRPLCITFGSPLVGDKKLQQAISRSSNWNSCFLHVVSHKDPLPRLFINSYMPFGTFLLCSDESSTCFENPDSTLEILKTWDSIHAQNQGSQSVDYGNVVESLSLKAICNDFSTQAEHKPNPDSLASGISSLKLTHPDSLTSGISLQLRALGLTTQVQLDKIKKLEQKFILLKGISFDPSKKLNQMKGYLAQLEWYKKETKNQQIGYYDSYKNMSSPWDYDVVEFHKKLTIYWEKMVEEAEMKPQTEGANFRKRYLYGGTTYRRMVEPLAIAQYYKDGGRDYVNKKRSKHFKQLEEWLNEASTKDKSNLNSTSRKNVEAILTIDSCFWARVEEGILSCKELKVDKENQEALKKLLDFEEYVYGLLKAYAVSPEIFLPQSSYMSWWKEYKAMKGTSYDSKLANFMNDPRKRRQYTSGTYDFP